MGNNNFTNYVCGFYFDHYHKRVVLIWKNKPKWQEGHLNGVGGKIESGETPSFAMRREFKEETGINHESWYDLVTLEGKDWRVYFFYAVGEINEFEYASTQETEEVAKIDVDSLDDFKHISNLRWLIPLALYMLRFPEEKVSIPTPSPKDQPEGEIPEEIGYKRVPKPCNGCSTDCYNWQIGDCREYEMIQAHTDMPKNILDDILKSAFEHAANRPPEVESHIRQESYITGAKWLYHKMQEEIALYKNMWMIADKTMNELRLKVQQFNKVING